MEPQEVTERLNQRLAQSGPAAIETNSSRSEATIGAVEVRVGDPQPKPVTKLVSVLPANDAAGTRQTMLCLVLPW